jgi:hypothetical protein
MKLGGWLLTFSSAAYLGYVASLVIGTLVGNAIIELQNAGWL